MKTNIRALKLVEKGLSSKTVAKLTESQINILYSKLTGRIISEAAPVSINAAKNPNALKLAGDLSKQGIPVQMTEKELGEQESIEPSSVPPPETDQQTRETGPGEYGNDDSVDKELDKNDADGMGLEEGKKKKIKKTNPWAICTAQLGKEFGTKERHLWNVKQKNKYERCVKDVKKSLKEGKNPVSLFLESQIMKIVERNIPPKITKRDLLKYLTENNPATAPSKPKESPPTKPGKPDTRPRPKHPGQKPKNVPNPSPKAAKEKVIDIIIDLLEK